MSMSKEAIRTHTQAILMALDQDDDTKVELELARLADSHHHQLLNELGHLTREVHQTIRNIGSDPLLQKLAESDVPDAKMRLQHVIDMTEQAANRTMTAVEQLVPLQEPLHEQAQQMIDQLDRLYRREMDPKDFAVFAKDTRHFLFHIQSVGMDTRKLLSDIMMAQEYQDLSGQIIRRVIDLVAQIEDKMVTMVSSFAQAGGVVAAAAAHKPTLEGPQVNAKGRKDVVSGQDEVDDLLSSLGF